MFDIGFSELLLVMVVGLIVLGPKRLPIAVKTVAGWIRALRSLATSVQHELVQELKLQELQDEMKKVQQAGLANLSPELQSSVDKINQVVESLKHSDPLQLGSQESVPVSLNDEEALHDQAIHNSTVDNPTIHNPTRLSEKNKTLERKAVLAEKQPEKSDLHKENVNEMLADSLISDQKTSVSSEKPADGH